jgi:hypothetical protein
MLNVPLAVVRRGAAISGSMIVPKSARFNVVGRARFCAVTVTGMVMLTQPEGMG